MQPSAMACVRSSDAPSGVSNLPVPWKFRPVSGFCSSVSFRSLTIVALLTSIVFISYGANCAQNSTSCAYVSVPCSPEMGDVPTVNTAAALSLPSPLRRTFTASSRCMAWICAPIWRSMSENRSSFWKRRAS